MPAKERHGLDGDVDKTCENCRFFAPSTSGTGDCRRHAPAPSNVRIRRMDEDCPRFESWWPVMNEDDWCGEFQPIDGTDW
jgi:hypothetical protein